MNRPNKSLGQHWLHDSEALQAMVTAAAVGPADTVLEIGPGLGTLTRHLVQAADQVVAVEFDDKLAARLPQRVPADNLRVVHRDILRYDSAELPPGYKVVANIPYYLTSNLLRMLCESSNPFSRAALLMQKEVAERAAARPGGMSLLSVSVQFYCDVELGRLVPADLFEPMPKVDSQILILTYRGPAFPGINSRLFFRLVKAGFAERRKKLRSSLSGGLHLSKTDCDRLLTSASINPDARAQELSMQQWHALYKAFIADQS